MRILFVTGEYPPQQGGVGAYTAELSRSLSALGAGVSVLTGREAEQSAAEARDDVAVYATVDRWGLNIWRSAAAQAAKLQADWIHVQYQTAAYAMNPAINLAPCWWRRAYRARTAWTYHDLLPPYLFPKAGARLRRWITELPHRTADLTIVTNEGDRLRLKDRRGRRLERIPIGSNIRARQLSADERTARRSARGYSGSDLLLAYFGFLNRSKGGLTLIRSLGRIVQAHPTVRLLMIGERLGASDPTNAAYLQEVEAVIEKLGLAEHVQWTGSLDDDDIAAELNSCDFLLLPFEDGASLRRGTLMAGLANGCAIITTTPQSPLPELVDHRDLLYVAPGSDEALARAVSYLVERPFLSTRLRENARERSRLFTWEGIAARHLALYAAPEASPAAAPTPPAPTFGE